MARSNLSTKTTPLEIIGEIVDGARDTKCIKIRYRDLKSNVTERTVEPYELKNGKLFAYDHMHNGIRSFTVSNIMSAGKTNQTYKPRYPVLIM